MRIALLAWLIGAALAGGCGPSVGRAGPARATGDAGAPDPGDLGPDGGGGDPDSDVDGDGYSPRRGDCDDLDPTTHPGAPERCDHKDHSCNGVLDDVCDDDGDGYNVCPGGDVRCAPQAAPNGKPGGDCDDGNPLVGPGAIELAGNGVDDNCDAQVDEAPAACDALFRLDKAPAQALAGAMELCAPWLVSAAVNNDADARSRNVKPSYGGTYRPRAGRNLAMLSTGLALDERDPGFVAPQIGTIFENNDANPLPMGNNGAACGVMLPDEQTVHDYSELTLRLQVPANARGLSFDFLFVSVEYPEFVGTKFNDKFLALLTSRAVGKGARSNISFDARGNPITVNAGFFGVCNSEPICDGQVQNQCAQPLALLDGTGMELVQAGHGAGGGTGWLTTEAPVEPGEVITLQFVVFDEGDHIYDSSVILDHFQWMATPPRGGGDPITHP